MTRFQRETRAKGPARQRGVVLVITLLATVFLAALVFYVFNLGHGTQSRLETQHAADAAAITGAGWTARSMNTIAMNNIAMTRQLAMVNVLDAMPKTVAFTLADQEAMLEAVQRQIERLPTTIGPITPAQQELLTLRNDLERIERTLADQVRMLSEVDELLNGPDAPDLREITFYQTPTGQRGRLWQAMEALDAFNQATVASMDAIAAAAAREAARANLRAVAMDEGDDLEVGAMLPRAWSGISAQRGRFTDFQGPITTGFTPRVETTASDDNWHQYRGPFDTVFGWRHINERIEREGSGSGDDYVSSGFNSPWSGGGPRYAGAIISREAISYSVYGMHEWLTRHFDGLNYRPADMIDTNPLGSLGALRYSGFRRHLAEIADIKLGYSPFKEQLGRRVIDPRWVIDYSTARGIHEAWHDSEHPDHENVPEIHDYRFIELVYTQLITPEGDGALQLDRWSIESRPGIEPPDLSRERPYIWRDEQVETPPDLAPQGIEVRHIHYYIFAGINIGHRVAVRNPYNFTSWAELPAPIDFNFEDASGQPDLLPDGGFGFLVVVRQPRASPMWPGAFDRASLRSDQFAVAEAQVFNNHSWDLWTQMWQARLVPVRDFEGWVEIAHEQWEAGNVSEVWWRDLQRVRPLAPLMLDH